MTDERHEKRHEDGDPEPYERRRSTDHILEKLLKGQAETHARLDVMERDMKPVLKFMEQASGAKTALAWILGIIAFIGAATTWALNVRDKLGHHGG